MCHYHVQQLQSQEWVYVLLAPRCFWIGIVAHGFEVVKTTLHNDQLAVTQVQWTLTVQKSQTWFRRSVDGCHHLERRVDLWSKVGKCFDVQTLPFSLPKLLVSSVG
jgi:hypothetical protein